MIARTRTAGMLLALLVFTAGLEAQMRSNKLGIGGFGSFYSYSGEYTVKENGMGGGLSMTYSPWQTIGFRAIVGVGQLKYTVTTGTNGAGSGKSLTNLMTLNGYLSANLMPNSKFNPFINVGAGYVYFDPRLASGTALNGAGVTSNDFNYFVGGGFDYFLSEFASVSFTGEMCISNTDRFDGYKSGSSTDGYMRYGMEVRYYFFDKAFLARMLEALKARYE